jgi:hypothetical protein
VNGRRACAALVAALGTVALCAAPAASAETLSVDDDRQDCTAAGYTSIQDAIDAAAPGDTIAICPGRYVEGNGAANSNALTIAKSLTLKGAGADLVTISPRRYDGNDGVIAEDPQSIRYPRGNIVTAVGTPVLPVTVDISGVTVDGNGVAAKAGVVFLDAQGSLRRSRVTDIVTSESPGAFDQPGGYRSSFLGYGVAQVTTAQVAPTGAGPRTLAIANTRIDEYNRIGVLIDGGTNSASPVTPSGLDLHGVITASQIVGRTLCWDAHVHGDCGGPNPPGNPDPKPIADGPLFGQDGIRLAAGARGTISGSIVTQNLVQGTGAPVRNSTTNNANLRQAAGIRLVDANATGSSVTRTNIVDNAYGVLNAAADGSGDAANPFMAENNWWGLCSPVGNNRCNGEPPGNTQPANTGPDVSPTFNPPYPENGVNGAPSADGSTAVDFMPFRNGPQSDPNTGQFPVVPAPIAVSDAAPAVTVRAEKLEYRRGETVKLIAEPSDDFGIRRVTFFDGAVEVGSDNSPPYEAAFTLPADVACGTRPVAATAEDSLGQTATGNSTAHVLCNPPRDEEPPVDEPDDPPITPASAPVPPTVKLPDNLGATGRDGAVVVVSPTAAQGVAFVDFFLGARRVCRDAEAPYQCRIKPLSSDIGSQTVRAVVTDRAGLTGQDSRQVVVSKFTPRGLTIGVLRKRLPGNRVQTTVVAKVLATKGVKRSTACADGWVSAVVSDGRVTLKDVQKDLDSNCRAVITRFTARTNDSRGLKYKVDARFGGTTVMVPVRKTRRFS